MSTFTRTQIYLGKDQMQKLKLEAQKNHRAVSALVRKAIDLFLNKKEDLIDWDADPLTKAIGKIKTGVKDLSVHHDYYLYGGEKRE